MTDWELMYDSRGDCARVPELLDRVERDHDPAAWEELERRLTVGAPLAFPASFAALPRLVRLAGSSRRARRLAGRIVRYAAATDGCDELFEQCTACVIELGRLLDEELRARPDHHLDPSAICSRPGRSTTGPPSSRTARMPPTASAARTAPSR
ncbi:hypothetical protein [Streptomyces sp. NPDC087297]|uniref:hypothetical protein n=1 Tax=Streptomyces sp. NPDC087297 TaxID=3365778 RepID=UPI003815B9FF